jgi:hypothetical protein
MQLELAGYGHPLRAFQHVAVNGVSDDRLVFAGQILVQGFDEILDGFVIFLIRTLTLGFRFGHETSFSVGFAVGAAQSSREMPLSQRMLVAPQSLANNLRKNPSIKKFLNCERSTKPMIRNSLTALLCACPLICLAQSVSPTFNNPPSFSSSNHLLDLLVIARPDTIHL